MGVAGDLGDFDLVGILQLLGSNRAAGRLRVSAGGDDVSLYLDLGRLVGVTSARLPLRLGRVLAQRGLVTEAQIQDALRIQETEGGGRSLGEILVARGWVGEEQVAACAHDQCVLALTRVLAAGEGTFAYESGTRLPARGPSFPLGAQAALLEALRRVDELGRLRALLPAPHVPLTISDLVGELFVPAGELEARLVGVLRTGAWSWRDLVDLIQADEPTLLRTLIALRERGVLIARSFGTGILGAPPPDEADLERLGAAPSGPADRPADPVAVTPHGSDRSRITGHPSPAGSSPFGGGAVDARG